MKQEGFSGCALPRPRSLASADEPTALRSPMSGDAGIKVLTVTTPQSTQSQKSSYIQLLPVGRGEGAT